MKFKKIIKKLFERYPKLTLFLRVIRDTLDQNQPILQSQWGFTFQGNPQMASGKFEPEETQVVRSLIPQIDIFINVGANIGYYCCHAHSLGKPVIAIEPITRNVNYLMSNMVNNGWEKNTQIFPIALGAHTDIMSIWGTDTGASLIPGWAGIPKDYVRKVPVLTLDNVLGEAINQKQVLILIDIEGAELEMLKGATKTLKNNIRPIWMIEITTHQNQPVGIVSNPNFKKTFELFFENGYRAFVASERNDRELSLEDIIKISDGLIKINNYNFIFR